MKIKRFIVEFLVVFITTFIVATVVNYVWAFNDRDPFNWQLAFRLAVFFGFTLPFARVFEFRKVRK